MGEENITCDVRGDLSDINRVKNFLDTNLCPMQQGFCGDRAPWGIRQFRGVNLHGVGVYFDEGYGRRTVTRTRANIITDSLTDFIVVIPLQRHAFMSQFGTVWDCGPGSFRVLSTAVPFCGYMAATSDHDKYTQLLGRIPGAMLRDLVPSIDELSNIPLRLKSGAGNIMKSLFDLALAEGGTLSDTQAREFSATLVRGIAMAVMDSAQYDKLPPTTRQSRRQQVLNRAKEFIHRNLANPDLDCALVANHCEVSLRYLQTVFAATTTIARYIRDARLDRCRAALRDTRLSGRTTAWICTTRGFKNVSSFNRCYRSRFGVAPGEDRRGNSSELKHC